MGWREELEHYGTLDRISEGRRVVREKRNRIDREAADRIAELEASEGGE